MQSVDACKLPRMIEELSKIIDFKKDLPSNIFYSKEFDFWFFERPIIHYIDLFSGLAAASYADFENNIIVKFSGDTQIANSCVIFNGNDPCVGAGEISSKFSNFLEGAVGYPIVFFNETYDWIAFESLYEELGVIAVRNSKNRQEFTGYLESNLITLEQLSEWSGRLTIESKIANAFLNSYLI